MRASRSAKKGMTSAIMKARIHVSAKIPAHEAHPMTVWLLLWRLPSKIRKKINLAETDEYKTPRKSRVGIMNENAIFAKTSLPKDPKAGAVLYCVPV